MNPFIRSPLDELGLNLTRRRFFEQGSHLLGGAALATLIGDRAAFGNASTAPTAGIERVAGAIAESISDLTATDSVVVWEIPRAWPSSCIKTVSRS